MEINIYIKDEKIVDIVAQALDGGINYWGQVDPNKSAIEMNSIENRFFITNKFGDEYSGYLDKESVQRGFSVMYEKYPIQFGKLLSDQYDNETVDVLVQCALFGSIIYS